MKRNSDGKLLFKGWTIKEIASIIFLISVVSGILGNILYQNYSEDLKTERRIEILKIESANYEKRMLSCANPSQIFPVFYENNPRSNQRLIQVLEGFNKVVKAECFKFQADKIYTNPYKGIDLVALNDETNSAAEGEIFQGILYEVDKGIPFLVTGGSICADGSFSGSVGRGTCSWHGGYATKRGYQFDYEASIYEYDPRIELESLQE